MKLTTRLLSLLACVAFSSSIGFSQVATKLKSELPTAAAADAPASVIKPVDRDLSEFEVTSLDLTPEQNKQYTAILAERDRKLATYRADASLSQADIDARVYESSLYYQRRMSKLLTPEQLKKRSELLAAPAKTAVEAISQ